MNFVVVLHNLEKGSTRNVFVDASDLSDANAQVIPLLNPGESVKNVRQAKTLQRRRKLSKDELSDFCLGLADLMEGGRTFSAALSEMAKEGGSKERNEMIERMLKRAIQGSSETTAFAAEVSVLGEMCASLVAQGELVKNVPGALKMYVRIIDRQVKQRVELIKNLAMPGVAAGVAVILLFAAGLFFIPMIRDLLESTTPNMLTRACFLYSEFMCKDWFVYGPVIALFVYSMILPRSRNFIFGIILARWKVARDSFVAAKEAEFMLLLGALVGNNVPNNVALEEIAKHFKGSPWYNQLTKAASDVKQGADMSSALALHTNLSSRTITTVAISMSSSRSAEKLMTGSDRAFFRSDRAFAAFSRWVTLAALLTVAGALLFVVIGCWGPVGQMISSGLRGHF